MELELILPQLFVGGGIVNEDAGGVDVLPGGGGSVKDDWREPEFMDMPAMEELRLPVDALPPNPEELPHGFDVA